MFKYVGVSSEVLVLQVEATTKLQFKKLYFLLRAQTLKLFYRIYNHLQQQGMAEYLHWCQ
jgi:hypothetical protein